MLYRIISFLIFFFGLCQNIGAQGIHDIARNGTVAQMQEILAKKPDALDELSERGITPLILACYRGNNEVAKYLMDNGANVSFCAAEG